MYRGVDEMNIVVYLLNIDGYGETFTTKAALVGELERKGLPTTLAEFDGSEPDKNGTATNSYNNASVTAYDVSAFER